MEQAKYSQAYISPLLYLFFYKTPNILFFAFENNNDNNTFYRLKNSNLFRGRGNQKWLRASPVLKTHQVAASYGSTMSKPTHPRPLGYFNSFIEM